MNEIQETLIIFAIGWGFLFCTRFYQYRKGEKLTILNKILLIISPIFSIACVIGILTK